MPRIRWTLEENERLLRLIAAGKSWTFISAALRRDTNSAKLHAERLRRAAINVQGQPAKSQGPTEERIVWRERFQAEYFDFRGKSLFTRFDCCEFVKCTLLIDHGTEQLAFTECVFKDCNIDKLEPDVQRGLYVRDNFFDRPLEQRRAELESRLAQALAARKAKGK
jgi:hypothetical protein